MERKKLNRKFGLMILLALFFGGLLIFHVNGLFVYQREGNIAWENSRRAKEMFESVILNAISDEPYYSENDFGNLAAARVFTANPDLVAYIAIVGTNIGNFVVQGRDNEHYLTHDANGQPNQNGAIFMDYRNSPNFSDPSTIIYGHNMRNGTMFHDLRHFMQQDFFEAHSQIIIVQDFHVLTYDIFAAFSTSVDFDYIQVDFAHSIEFQNLIDEMSRRSVINTGIIATHNDRILILSTCTNVREDTRFVIAARLQ